MASTVRQFINVPVYEVPDDTPTQSHFGNREVLGLPSTSCARIREVTLRHSEKEGVLQALQCNTKGTSEENQIKQTEAVKEITNHAVFSDESSKENRSHVEDLILEYQLKYERLNSIMRETQAQVVESQNERSKFLDAYSTCVNDLKEELFKKETDVYKCQQELDRVRLELEKARMEIKAMKDNGIRHEDANVPFVDNPSSLASTSQNAAKNQQELDSVKLELEKARMEIKIMKEKEIRHEDNNTTFHDNPSTLASTIKNAATRSDEKPSYPRTVTNELPRTPPNATVTRFDETIPEDQRGANVSRISRKPSIMNASLADLKSPMMTPCTPRGRSRKSRRSSLHQFISKSTCETENREEILKETIVDLKEVLDCYATLTGFSVSLDKCPDRQNQTNSMAYFNVKSNNSGLHKDFEIALGIDDAYDEIEYTPTFLENPDVAPHLLQKLPNCLKEKTYITTDQGSLLLGDILAFVRQ